MFHWVPFDLYTINTEAQSFPVSLFLLQVHPEGHGLFDVQRYNSLNEVPGPLCPSVLLADISDSSQGR